MTLAHPLMLLLLLLVPLVVYLYLRRLREPATFTLSTTGAFDPKHRSLRALLHPLPDLLLLLSLVAVIVALARPQRSTSHADKSTEGINISMVLDISASMLARDLEPDRINAAKEVAADFVKGRPYDNIGLVVFAGESYTQCPLTTDHTVLLNQLQAVRMGLIDDGTAIGSGLATAVSRLKDLEGNSKVVILLTDGTNNAGAISPRTAAEIAQTYGIRVYTVGVGTRGQALYPVRTDFGIEYQPMQVEIDEEMLQEIAQMTGGSYFRATDNESLQQIYQEIDQMEKVKLKVEHYTTKSEYFYYFVWAAFALAFIGLLLRLTFFRSLP